MVISRRFALLIHTLLDEFTPPILRDQRWFMWLPFKILFREHAETFFRFKEEALTLSEEEFAAVYEETAEVHIQRETDLNLGCIEAILGNIAGQRVLEAGCGRAYLAGRLAARHTVTACDMIIGEGLADAFPAIHFCEENLQRLSFADNTFDTVVCTHAIEHLQDPRAAVSELRRVATRRLIIVVPKQRPYRYTFDLHLHFFPYAHSLRALIGAPSGAGTAELREVEGDWYYQEELA